MKKAILLGTIASLLWSTVFVFGRYLCNVLGIHPILVAFLRFACAGAISILYVVLKGEARSLSLLAKKAAKYKFARCYGDLCYGRDGVSCPQSQHFR